MHVFQCIPPFLTITMNSRFTLNIEIQITILFTIIFKLSLFFHRSATVPIRGSFKTTWRILPFQWLSETMYLLITRWTRVSTNCLPIRIRNKRYVLTFGWFLFKSVCWNYVLQMSSTVYQIINFDSKHISQ